MAASTRHVEQGSAWQRIATIPEIAWEPSLGIYLTFNGFKASSPRFER